MVASQIYWNFDSRTGNNPKQCNKDFLLEKTPQYHCALANWLQMTEYSVYRFFKIVKYCLKMYLKYKEKRKNYLPMETKGSEFLVTSFAEPFLSQLIFQIRETSNG